MAAATKRQGKTWSRRRRRKQKVQLTKPLLKWRGSPARVGWWKPAPKGLSGWLEKGSYNRYISRLLSQLPPPTRRMSVKAKRLMNISMGVLCKGLVTEADRRRRKRRGSFIGTLELQAAVDKVMKGEGGGCSTSSILSRSSCMN